MAGRLAGMAAGRAAFPQLLSATSTESPSGQTPALPESGPGPIVVPDSPRGRSSRMSSATRKKPESRSKSAVALMVTLLSMVLVLLVVLVLVVRGAA